MRITFLPIVLIICSVSFSQHPGWTAYTNCNNNINALAESGNEIWVGTKSGLVKSIKHQVLRLSIILLILVCLITGSSQ